MSHTGLASLYFVEECWYGWFVCAESDQVDVPFHQRMEATYNYVKNARKSEEYN